MRFGDATTRSGVLRELPLILGKSLGKGRSRMCMVTMTAMVMGLKQLVLNHP